MVWWWFLCLFACFFQLDTFSGLVSVTEYCKWKFSLHELILRYSIAHVVHLVVSHTEWRLTYSFISMYNIQCVLTLWEVCDGIWPGALSAAVVPTAVPCARGRLLIEGVLLFSEVVGQKRSIYSTARMLYCHWKFVVSFFKISGQ